MLFLFILRTLSFTARPRCYCMYCTVCTVRRCHKKIEREREKGVSFPCTHSLPTICMDQSTAEQKTGDIFYHVIGIELPFFTFLAVLHTTEIFFSGFIHRPYTFVYTLYTYIYFCMFFLLTFGAINLRVVIT